VLNEILSIIRSKARLPPPRPTLPLDRRTVIERAKETLAPFDELMTFDRTHGAVQLSDERLRQVAGLLDCIPENVEDVVRLHGTGHQIMWEYLRDDYRALEERLVEHYLHHLVFWLLFKPTLLEESMGIKGAQASFEGGSGHLNTFLALHELQPKDVRVRDRDFTRYPPTWVLASLRLMRYGLRRYEDWYRRVFQSS